MHVLSLPPAFVLSQDQTLKFNKTLIWLYLVTHESTRTFTPRCFHILVDFILTKRDPPKSRSNIAPLAGCVFSRTLPPTFLFLQYSVFKEQTPQTRCRGPIRFWLLARSSVAHAALLNFSEGRFRSELLRRQRRAALVGEAYIVGGPSKCQLRF